MSGNTDWKSASTIYDFTARDIQGNDVSLDKYQDHVCVIVNVASKCGLTATNYKNFFVCSSLPRMPGYKDWKSASTIYDFTARDIRGNEVSLDKYRGQVCIIVNVASKCGLAGSNYKELEELKEEYGESKGLRILAFPCNQFNGQEPGDSEQIACYALRTMGATFDLFEKVEVNGDNAHPLWKFLKKKQLGTLGDAIKWNFTKFIVDREGRPVERFAPTTEPKKMESTLKKYF